jgi:RND superfamily putative drug exporter
MQRAMVALEQMINRRRVIVVVASLALLLAAVPFAMRQSDHLTGGGFNVPGSQGENVRLAMDRGFAGGERAALGVVLVPAHPGPSASAALTAALNRA